MNRHRKNKPKPPIDVFLRQKVQEVCNVVGPICSVTLIVGDPANPDSDVVFSTNPRHAQLVLARRTEQVKASLAAGGRIDQVAPHPRSEK